jgi:hypothetical protein
LLLAPALQQSVPDAAAAAAAAAAA